jgi:hypothetical protein
LTAWEIWQVTTICTADKNRLTVRGVRNGARYLVKKKSNGWWIEPAPQPRRRIREVKAATRDLSDHLAALANEGFAFEPLPKGKVPPCRF